MSFNYVTQRYVGSIANWIELRSLLRTKIALDFDSEVTWQYRKVTGQTATGFRTVSGTSFSTGVHSLIMKEYNNKVIRTLVFNVQKILYLYNNTVPHWVLLSILHCRVWQFKTMQMQRNILKSGCEIIGKIMLGAHGIAFCHDLCQGFMTLYFVDYLNNPKRRVMKGRSYDRHSHSYNLRRAY